MADRKLLYRGMKIAASAVCLVVCVVMCWLWSRSYQGLEYITAPITKTNSFALFSEVGYIDVEIMFTSLPRNYENHAVDAKASERWGGVTTFGFGLTKNTRGCSVVAPYWFLVLVFATLAALPWFRWRFSLRTLFIAVTLVAVALGAIVYFVRQ